MPQINVYTFLSQTTWLIVIFIIYYINMKQILIPSLIEIIKLKKYFILKKPTTSTQIKINYLNI